MRKSRRFRAEVLIPLGNLYLYLQEAQVEVLSVGAWIEWELLVARQLGREVLIAEGGLGIETRVLAGRTLEDILREDGSLEDKLAAITAASVALRELHQLNLTGGRVSNWAFSHGDATCRNVMLGGPENSAHWFDFDTSHVTSQPADFRQADDVRALLMSCAVWLAPPDYGQCVAGVFHGYADDRVAATVQRMVQREQQVRVFHLAQAPLSFDNWHVLRDAVLACRKRSAKAR
jgi:tRNA A-37 threonylcarbamoyl transferase component Bud32